MDEINEVEILETNVRDFEGKSKQVNCSAMYDAIIATFKLLYDLVFLCFKKETCM